MTYDQTLLQHIKFQECDIKPYFPTNTIIIFTISIYYVPPRNRVQTDSERIFHWSLSKGVVKWKNNFLLLQFIVSKFIWSPTKKKKKSYQLLDLCMVLPKAYILHNHCNNPYFCFHRFGGGHLYLYSILC